MEYYSKENFDVTETIGFRVTKARNVIACDMEVALKGLDITPPQMSILLVLARGEIDSPVEIARYLAIDSGFMTRAIDKLERAGMLVRSRNEQDRRVINLHLTQKGEQLASSVVERVPDVLNERLRRFTPEEFDTLRRLLEKFANG